MVLRPMLIRVSCVVAPVGLLVFALRRGGWGLAAEAMLRVGPGALVLALGVTLVSMIVSGIVWTRVLGCLGYRTPVRVGLTAYAGTGLASYVGSSPGAIGGCVAILRWRGVCAGRAALLMGIANLIGFCGALIWAPTGVALLASPEARHALPALGAHAPLIAIVAATASAMGAVVGLWLFTAAPRLGPRWRIARLVTDGSAPPLHLHLRQLLALVPCASLGWLVGTAPLWLLVRAASPGLSVSLSAVIAVQSVAAVVGGVTFFLPNGLGARDGVIVALLVGMIGMPLPAAAAVALLVRISDPLGKALILLGVAAVGRIPALALPRTLAWHSTPGALQATIGRRALPPLRPETTA